MSKKPDTSTPPDKSKFRSSNRLIGNNNQDKPEKKKNNNKSESKPPTPVEVKVSPPPTSSSEQIPPTVRVVNGPGSSPTPEQPKNQFLNKNTGEPKLVTVTSLATSESKL